MKTTGNLGLKKPDGTDIVDITDLNGNMDILDTAVKAVQDHAADAVKHITATERTAWNAKASTAAATASAAGLMAAADKAKLDGVAAGANNYVHPNHTGDVTSTGDGVTAIAPGVIVNADVNAAAAIDATKIGTGVVSNAEFGYLDGVTAGIQGQLNGKANLTTTPQQTTADITYYVRTDGNDGNTGLGNTAGGAFRTITKAISLLPKIVNRPININVAAGTYPESIIFEGFSGGSIIAVNGAATAVATHMINNFIVNECSVQIIAYGLTATTTTASGFIAQRTNGLLLARCIVNTASSNPGVFADSSFVQMGDSCSISNRGAAINGHVNAVIFSQGTTGSGNNTAFNANYGSKISYSGAVPGATLLSSANEGGMIIPAGGVINPWGDNNPDSRSYVRASSNAALSAPPYIAIKLLFNLEGSDTLSEFSNGTFAPKKSGRYLVSAGALMTGFGPNSISDLYLYVNGTPINVVRSAFTLDLQTANLNMVVHLNAGDYMELYFGSSSAGYVGNGASDKTFLTIQRIA